MKNSIRSFAMTAILALLPLGAMADGNFSVFSPKTGFADGWKSSAWSGPVANQVAGETKETTLLQISLMGEPKAYAGVILSAVPGSGVQLTEKLRKSGTVKITVKIGKTLPGAIATADQPLQLGLTYLTAEGETVHGNFNTQANIAAGPDSQVLSISVPAALAVVKNPAQLASISGVRFQYLGEPVAGFVISDCTIKSE